MPSRPTDTPLNDRQRAVLAAVCETLLPEIRRDDDPEGFFATGAARAGTAARVEQLIASLADPRDRSRIRTLLDALGSPLANLVLSGRPASLTRLPPAAREMVLRGWAHSRLPLRRAGFQALKRLAHVAYYGWPVTDGSNPAWRHVGYPGPLPQPEQAIEPLPTLPIERDTTLECDVVVVGSGAGGGVVAGVLAAAGRSVVVLEKGPNPGSRDMSQVEGEMLSSLYLDGGLVMTQSGSMPVLAGSCLGGGTVINYSTSFPLPEKVRHEWEEVSGLSLFTSNRFTESFDRVSARVNVGTRWTTPGRRDELLEQGLRALDWHVDVMPRNVTDCKEGLECGYCGYGCRHGAKNSTARTYLADAAAAGARMVVGCEVERVLHERGRASGVAATVRGPGGSRHRLTVHARAVVAAAGGIHTPAILRRSGLANRNVGRHLRLHPATAVMGVFPERVTPWEGSLQTRYSDQFADQHAGYGAKFETAPAHFVLAASAFGWESAHQFRQDVAGIDHYGLCGVLLRDRDPGRVVVGRDGRPRVHYELSRFDARHVREAVRGAAQVLAAAGAREIFTLQTPPARARTSEPLWLDRLMAAADARGYRYCRMSYITFHQVASARMGRSPADSVVGESGEAHELKGLYVADGSSFPTSSGVNPMLTIMAIADHVARAIQDRW
ncbi:MAG: FAD-dependent oxidoreductase [Gemmatimonadota bacterium]|nr:MAG: FAD-dependent oxidoreductase [Gemmatimonadota bacterium]